jgi:hypothetical protein
MELSSSAKLQFLIGDVGYAFCNEFGIFYDVHGEMFLICLGNCLLINLRPYFWFSTKLSKTLKNSLRIDEKVGQCNRKCSRSSSVSVLHKGQ